MTAKRTLAMLPVLFGIGLGAGLGVSAPAAAQTKEVKIGLIAPMSGPWARQGDLMLKGANLDLTDFLNQRDRDYCIGMISSRWLAKGANVCGAGGVGLIMCQWARHLGVRVIGTVSTPAKAELAKANGCDHPIIYTKEDVVARVHELSNREGLPVVFDGVGGSTFETSLQCLRRRGLVVSYGTAGGIIPPFDLFRLNQMGSLYVTSAGLADYLHDRAEMLERAADLFAMMKSGAVRVPINQRYALADAARAHRDLEERRTSGASILMP